ncbi:MAG TPA: hypothetical protein VIO39_02860 [Methylotenera sp.]
MQVVLASAGDRPGAGVVFEFNFRQRHAIEPDPVQRGGLFAEVVVAHLAEHLAVGAVEVGDGEVERATGEVGAF